MRRKAVLLALPALLVATVATAVAGPGARHAAHADAAAQGGDYIAVNPQIHVLDTRSKVGVTTTTPLAGGKYYPFQVAGVGGIPAAASVTGVVVDLTVVSPTASGWLFLGPNDGPATAPTGSNVNYLASSSPISNSVVVKMSADGKFKVWVSGGTAHVVVDVQGYYTATTGTSGPGGFVPVPHSTIIDTRNGTGGVKVAAIAAGGSLTANLSATGAIPSGSPSAYADIIVTSAADAGYLGVYPYGAASTTMTSITDFLAGTTASGATLKLGTNNSVVFVNRSASAINLVLTAEGYTSAVSTSGAGYRGALVRTVSGLTIAANDTASIPVLGLGGVPTHGVAAVAANFTVVGGTAAGFLKVYPSDGTAPPTSVANFPASTTRADLAFVRPGADGRVKVLNNTSQPVHIYVDVQGYYSDGNPTGVDIAPYSPVAIAQPIIGGNVEGVYVRNTGQLFHGTAPADSLDQSVWAGLPGLEAFTGEPSIAKLPNGNLLVAAQHASNGEIWTLTEPASTGTTLATWNTTFTHTAGIMASGPVVGTLPNGNPVNFGVDANGQLWALPTTGGTYWQAVGSNVGLVGPVSVVANSSAGTLNVVGRTTTGTVVTASYNSSNVLGAWTDLHLTGAAGRPAAIEVIGPRLRVVSRTATGGISTIEQTPSGSWPTAWSAVDTQGHTFIGDPAVAIDTPLGSSSAAGTDDQSILVRDSQDSYLYESDETSAGTGTFGAWFLVAGQNNPAATDPVAIAFGGSGNNFNWIAAALDTTGARELVHRPVA